MTLFSSRSPLSAFTNALFCFCFFVLSTVFAQESTDDSQTAQLQERPFSESPFVSAFIQSFSVTVVSELGDKTFLIAAIMAMKNLRSTVFIGAAGALLVMTTLSVAMGWATTIIPRRYTYNASIFLFFVFGLKMLKEAYEMTPEEEEEELEEVAEEIQKKEEEEYDEDSNSSLEKGKRRSDRNFLRRYLPPVMIQTFVLTFLGEWGDRSQITTIALASREDPVGVALGGFLGHSGCTALAVFGGRMLAQRISVRTVTFLGGLLFLGFAFAGIMTESDTGFDNATTIIEQ